ncbi:putative ATP-dependent (S)-NAD(P)H-hydrate dehydratase [Clavispora lusitaniae]|uniref:ATP-dependent (S)-NAD(P)H-hydrate dehydratase n=1 Tax=Clavispora lusitaniae TaxID=36911 RepID=A0ACD0WLA4_CLALS|nr:hypothetical protein E0198_002995 [Clavispora lusitaniae]QFZ28116.1 putative ATP-dependent (S)-NAD(P)H-hydrate dehydratase [Clavispora lusitaniae]QFZ33779.1 putative ATP-dependent (S)-NAD(P)H-hydrate dehydratase [Clavispora lusitaniae]QFZ39463.1 putative ATP-dependent (S)-NAD(P)H-hydrate dehydratase [Clavispora lusitaniae]QFZ45145.1 putative ATP-dependent (S)-NAD(P)H-hydrate dehydratase [Clavispora lusitaniae]
MLSGKSHKELLQLARGLVPQLKASMHKGQAGKIGVFGGCEDYTGAPFFAAHAAAIVGADLSHVVCERLAAPIIKGYSPDLMVHPYLYASDNVEVERFAPREVWKNLARQPLEEGLEVGAVKKVVEEHILPKLAGLVERLDVFVVGPGFGRDPLMLATLARVVEEIKVADKTVVLDADALFLVSKRPSLVSGYKKAVLTPNVVEFARLCEAVGVDSSSDGAACALSQALGGVIVVRKGGAEEIVRGDKRVVNDMDGSPRRVGGQGDSLAGTMATMLVWAGHYDRGDLSLEPGVRGQRMGADESALVACFAASAVVRVASARAFAKHGRAMQTSDVHACLGEACQEVLGDAW